MGVHLVVCKVSVESCVYSCSIQQFSIIIPSIHTGTVEPTTMGPTTMGPTTMEPTTMEPTTMEPTTMPPGQCILCCAVIIQKCNNMFHCIPPIPIDACMDLMNPQNGAIMYSGPASPNARSVGTVATYSCSSGYTLMRYDTDLYDWRHMEWNITILYR